MLSQDVEWNKLVRMIARPFLERELNRTVEELQKFQENVNTIFQDMEEEDIDDAEDRL